MLLLLLPFCYLPYHLENVFQEEVTKNDERGAILQNRICLLDFHCPIPSIKNVDTTMELVGITLSKTYCTHKLFMHTYVQIPYFPYFNTVTTHMQEYMAGGWVVLGLVLYLRGRNQWQLPAEMNTHKHTHNCTMIFTRNIGEVMALWAISLSSSAVEVQRKRFQSLITEQSSHSTHTDRYLSQRYTAADKIQHESFAVHTSITDTDDGLFTSKTHYDESKKK